MASISIFSGSRIIGPGTFTPAIAIVLMSFWVMRVITWPGAWIEAIVVVPIGFVVVWRFIRVGVWVNGETLVVRNAWETLRAPLSEVKLRSGFVDDISEFDRFTGGQANKYRSRVGDQFADRKFLRYRLVIDGKEHEVDAFFGRTPKSQLTMAERIREYVEIEEID